MTHRYPLGSLLRCCVLVDASYKGSPVSALHTDLGFCLFMLHTGGLTNYVVQCLAPNFWTTPALAQKTQEGDHRKAKGSLPLVGFPLGFLLGVYLLGRRVSSLEGSSLLSCPDPRPSRGII